MNRRKDASAIGAAGVGTASALTAALASACCVGPSIAPIAISVLGASGLIAVSYLRPFTPLLLVVSALMLAFSFWMTYSRTGACAAGGVRAPISRRLLVARIVTWIAALLWLASVADSLYGFFHE